jgi:hypothetical protein
MGANSKGKSGKLICSPIFITFTCNFSGTAIFVAAARKVAVFCLFRPSPAFPKSGCRQGKTLIFAANLQHIILNYGAYSNKAV